MYFVIYGDLIRYTGNETWDPDELPDNAYVFDFDDRSKWKIGKLKTELERCEGSPEDDVSRHVALLAEIDRRNHADTVEETDDLDEVWDFLSDADDEGWYDDEDLDEAPETPIVMLEDLSPDEIRLIRELAKAERESESARAAVLDGKDENAPERINELEKKIVDLIMQLMTTDLAIGAMRFSGAIESMKNTAAQLLFLYAQERTRAEMSGGKPDEDFFYAGNCLYSHAMFAQLQHTGEYDEDDEDEDEDVDDEDEDVDDEDVDDEDEDDDDDGGEEGILHHFPLNEDDLPF